MFEGRLQLLKTPRKHEVVHSFVQDAEARVQALLREAALAQNTLADAVQKLEFSFSLEREMLLLNASKARAIQVEELSAQQSTIEVSHQ